MQKWFFLNMENRHPTWCFFYQVRNIPGSRGWFSGWSVDSAIRSPTIEFEWPSRFTVFMPIIAGCEFVRGVSSAKNLPRCNRVTCLFQVSMTTIEAFFSGTIWRFLWWCISVTKNRLLSPSQTLRSCFTVRTGANVPQGIHTVNNAISCACHEAVNEN